MRLCNYGEISSSGVLIINTIKRGGWVGFCNVENTAPPPQPRLLILVVIKTTDDEISPQLRNRMNHINTNTLSDVNLMMARIGRNM